MVHRSLKLLVVPAVLLAAFFLFSAEEANAGWGYYSGWGGHSHSHFGHSHFGHGHRGIHVHVGHGGFGFHYSRYPVHRHVYYPRVRAYSPYYGGHGRFYGGYGGYGCR